MRDLLVDLHLLVVQVLALAAAPDILDDLDDVLEMPDGEVRNRSTDVGSTGELVERLRRHVVRQALRKDEHVDRDNR